MRERPPLYPHSILACLSAGFLLTSSGAFSASSLAEPTEVATQTVRGAVILEHDLTIHPDYTSELVQRTRVHVLTEAMLMEVGQQNFSYIDGLETFELSEAYTEKADGRRIPVDPSSIITRDAAGSGAVYMRDQKVVTAIFPDVAVGDAVVFTARLGRNTNMFPNHYSDRFVFPRHFSLHSARLTIRSAKDLFLNVATTSGRFMKSVTETDDTRTVVLTHEPSGRVANEPGAVSVFDREPAVLISTFKDYPELGRAFAREAVANARVTSEIQALAEEVTRGMTERRTQADAIVRWVKRNIRYVGVYLGAGRVVPNEAGTVLRMKYGDCKDHAVLAAALLAAKGIATEYVMVFLGDSYTLPELPIAAAFNHVMIYLPEFKIYEDPTLALVNTGVIAAQTYDKPVLRVSADGARLDRTPPMDPREHVAISRTRLDFSTDGSVTGETRHTTTGTFATTAREVAVRIQQMGVQAAAERALVSDGFTGKGEFTFDHRLGIEGPFVVTGKFALNERLKIPVSPRIRLPSGMHILARLSLFGPRHPGRSMDFACYAGAEVEELEVTFAEGLPLPRPPHAKRIDTDLITYTAESFLDGRTLKIRRELTSRVSGQKCRAGMESTIAHTLAAVRDNMGEMLTFDPAPTSVGNRIGDGPDQVELHSSENPVGATLASALSPFDGLPIRLNDTYPKVQRAYQTDLTPEPTESAAQKDAKALRLRTKGVWFFFDPGGRIYTIRLDAPFAGSVGGVKIGDSLAVMRERLGRPVRTLPAERGLPQRYFYHIDDRTTARFDADAENKIMTVYLIR